MLLAALASVVIATKAITAEDTVRENPVIRDGGVPNSPTSTLPATEQWVRELWVKRQIHALVAVDTHGFASLRSL